MYMTQAIKWLFISNILLVLASATNAIAATQTSTAEITNHGQKIDWTPLLEPMKSYCYVDESVIEKISINKLPDMYQQNIVKTDIKVEDKVNGYKVIKYKLQNSKVFDKDLYAIEYYIGHQYEYIKLYFNDKSYKDLLLDFNVLDENPEWSYDDYSKEIYTIIYPESYAYKIDGDIVEFRPFDISYDDASNALKCGTGM